MGGAQHAQHAQRAAPQLAAGNKAAPAPARLGAGRLRPLLGRLVAPGGPPPRRGGPPPPPAPRRQGGSAPEAGRRGGARRCRADAAAGKSCRTLRRRRAAAACAARLRACILGVPCPPSSLLLETQAMRCQHGPGQARSAQSISQHHRRPQCVINRGQGLSCGPPAYHTLLTAVLETHAPDPSSVGRGGGGGGWLSCTHAPLLSCAFACPGAPRPARGFLPNTHLVGRLHTSPARFERVFERPSREAAKRAPRGGPLPSGRRVALPVNYHGCPSSPRSARRIEGEPPRAPAALSAPPCGSAAIKAEAGGVAFGSSRAAPPTQPGGPGAACTHALIIRPCPHDEGYIRGPGPTLE